MADVVNKIKVHIHADGSWPDLTEKEKHGKLHYVSNREVVAEVAGMHKGTKDGAPTFLIRTDLDNGETVIVEFTMAQFLAISDVFREHYGDEAKGTKLAMEGDELANVAKAIDQSLEQGATPPPTKPGKVLH